MTEQLTSPVPEVIGRMYSSLESGDFARFETCFTPDAKIWHNVDEQVLDMPVAQIQLEQLARGSNKVAYLERRAFQLGNMVFLQHVLTAALKSGAEMRLPAMMRVELSDDGLIAWIDEYFDSRGVDVAMGAPAH